MVYLYSFFNLDTRSGWVVNDMSQLLTPGIETLYPLYRRLGGPRDWSGRVGKNSPPMGFETRTIQPIAYRCMNYTTSVTVAV